MRSGMPKEFIGFRHMVCGMPMQKIGFCSSSNSSSSSSIAVVLLLVVACRR